MQKKFVILGTGSTGTTWIVSILNSHPEILCHGELYRKNKIAYRGQHLFSDPQKKQLLEISSRNDRPIKFLQNIFKISSPAHKSIGFKLLLNDNKEVLNYVCANPDILKIVIYRDNWLAAYSSRKLVDLNGYVKTDEIKEKPIFDAENFEKFRKNRTQAYEKVFEALNSSQSQYITLEYLEFKKSPSWSKIFQFLNVSNFDVADNPQTKRNTDVIIDRFANPNDVLVYLAKVDKSNWVVEQ